MSRSQSIRKEIAQNAKLRRGLFWLGIFLIFISAFILFTASLPMYLDGYLALWGGLGLLAGCIAIFKKNISSFVIPLFLGLASTTTIHWIQLIQTPYLNANHLANIESVLLEKPFKINRKGSSNDEICLRLLAYPLFNFSLKSSSSVDNLAAGDTVNIDISEHVFATKLKRTKPLSFIDKYFEFFEIEAYGLREEFDFYELATVNISSANDKLAFNCFLYGFISLLLLLVIGLSLSGFISQKNN